MRAIQFAAGLTLAATAAVANPNGSTTAPDTNAYVTLTNGCVYAPNLLTQSNEWSLVYTQAGTTVQCPLTIYGQSARTAETPAPAATVALVPPAEPAPLGAPETVTQAATLAPAPYVPTRRIRLQPRYVVGVFR
ncbi:hypothetical protein [Tateyamaria sp. SN6-1]|uniref:hypothetical protein n=1 Tax=Tateyamaria sp. SN6-1 TaxID=3092148 RepID=UPI0039F50BF5